MISYEPFYKTLKDKNKCAAKLNELIKESSPTVWKQQYKNGDNAITPNQVDDIKSGARFGVRANGDKVTYKLILSASYFPTLFTYSCYLPINKHFLKETKWGQFGTDNTKISTILLNTNKR